MSAMFLNVVIFCVLNFCASAGTTASICQFKTLSIVNKFLLKYGRVSEISIYFYQNENFWVEKYNLTDQNPGYMKNVYYQSDAVLPEQGIIAMNSGKEAMYTHVIAKIRTLLPFRVANYVILLNFYHGSSTTVHTLDSTTGEHVATRLGKGLNQKSFFIVRAGIYVGVKVDIGSHAVLGVSFVNESNRPSTFIYKDVADMVKQFSPHSVLLNRFYGEI